MSSRTDPSTIRTSLDTIIETETKLFKGYDRRIYARFRSDDAVEIVCVDSERFKAWLTQQCVKAWMTPHKQAIELAIESVKAKPWSDLDPVGVRVGTTSPDDVIYWDLSDGTGRAIEITASGWNIVDDPAVLFPTHETRQRLGTPKSGGSIHDLRERFGLSAHNEALIFSFFLGCLRGTGPYPVLAILGPDGCGKTALATFLCAVLDPATQRLRNIPKNQKELAITARDNHVLAYDNIQVVPPWLGSAVREVSKGTIFTECSGGREHILFEGARPVILVGSDEMLLNRELASRALVVRLDPRTSFVSGIEEDFRGVPEIQGALLDIVAHGLGRLPELEALTPIRDYEFERWIEACELSRWGLEVQREAYEANVSEGLTDLIELDPLLVAFGDYMAEVKTFRGTAGQLLKKLDAAATITKGNRWPKSPRALSGQLRRDARLLPEINLEFNIMEGHNHNRIIVANLKPSSEQPQVGNAKPPQTSVEATTGRRRKTPAKKSAPADQLGLFVGR
jgi:hypothetical protein